MILPDNETKVDLLNNEAIATTIVSLLRERPDHPVTIGVHGDWGAGKSSILEMIEARLDTEDGVLCLKFNGWRFQGFEDAKIALIEGIVTGLVEKRPALAKAGVAVKDIFRRIDWLKVAKKAGGLALTAYTGIPTREQIEGVVAVLERVIADPAQIVSKENVQAVVDATKGLLKPSDESKNVAEEIGAFRKAFDRLLKDAGVAQLIVLIDDLDRCLPDTAIETLEAVRLFVFTSRTAFVVAADEAMIEYAVRKHFPDLPDTTGPQTYARNYLEKLIQVPFRIPALGESETRIYVTLLLVGAELGEQAPEFEALISSARLALRRPWIGGVLDDATVRSALGEKAARVQDALNLSDQLGPVLASGTKGNPRQIKRFLNTLTLRQRTAEARGFGADVKLPVLAKLMLAERFLVRLFEQIASIAAAAPDGACKELGDLEAAISADRGVNRGPDAKAEDPAKEDKRAAKPKLEVAKEPDSALLDEWLASPSIRAWASVTPSLAGLDLRPYLFVTKDRKDYLGAASALGQLASVVEQLLGPKLAVQALGADLRRLAGPEASQVFEALRGRIIGSDEFQTEPPGVAGLAVLVKAHPSLQERLLDCLEALPRTRLGPWVCGGWEGVLKDNNSVQRYERLLERWSEDGSQMLKTAAQATLRMRRGR
ncbi:MAG: P-loop NTPase fold protein [Myxococcota bacterium]|nr:P-loop NTPase fold protein [Myxococcota bacterium]